MSYDSEARSHTIQSVMLCSIPTSVMVQLICDTMLTFHYKIDKFHVKVRFNCCFWLQLKRNNWYLPPTRQVGKCVLKNKTFQHELVRVIEQRHWLFVEVLRLSSRPTRATARVLEKFNTSLHKPDCCHCWNINKTFKSYFPPLQRKWCQLS